MRQERTNTNKDPFGVAAQRLGALALALPLLGVLAVLAVARPQLVPSVPWGIENLPEPPWLFIGGCASALPVALTALMFASLSTEHHDRRQETRSLRTLGKGAIVILLLWLVFTAGIDLAFGNTIFFYDAVTPLLGVALVPATFTFTAALSLTSFIRTHWDTIPPASQSGAKVAIAAIVVSTVAFTSWLGYVLLQVL